MNSPTTLGPPSRPSTRDIRSPSPFARGPFGTSTGLSSLSRPSSPTKSSYTAASRTDFVSSSALPTSNILTTLSSVPPTTFYPTSGSASTGTGSGTARPPVTSTSPSRTRSPLASVRNLVAAWKERTPKPTQPAKTLTSTSSTASDSFFGLRRRVGRIPRTISRDTLPDLPKEADTTVPPHDAEATASSESDKPGASRGGSVFRAGERRSTESSSRRSGTGSSSGNIPPPFDIAELGSYARGSQEVRYLICCRIGAFLI